MVEKWQNLLINTLGGERRYFGGAGTGGRTSDSNWTGGKDFVEGTRRRNPQEILSAKERKDNFDMVDHGICDADICQEASRCLQCDLRMDITRSKIWSDYDGEEGEKTC